MPVTQPAPFADLLSSAWTLVKSRMNVLLPGVILFAIIAVLVQMPLAGIERMDAAPTPENIGIAVVASLASVLATVIGYLYYLLAVTGTDTSVGTILKKTLPRIFPFIGLSLLIMLRTFAWISLVGGLVMMYGGMVTYAGNMESGAFFMLIGTALLVIGTVCALVLGPRYLLAPVLWVMEGSGVREAVKRSYAVSNGYWGKIFGNTLLLGLIFMIIMVCVGILAKIVGEIGDAMAGIMTGSILIGLVTAFFSQFYNVIFITFALKLSATIIAHPRGTIAPVNVPAASVKPVKAATPLVSASRKPGKKAVANKKPSPKKKKT